MRRLLALALCACLPAVAVGQAEKKELEIRLDSAVQRWLRGDRDAANREFQTFIDVYNQRAEQMTSRELAAVAVAVTYLGVDDPQLFKDALRAYDRAIEKDPNNIDARVKLGELFLDKYNGAEAKRSIDAALAKDGAHVAALVADAKRRSFDNERGADSVLDKALARSPEDVGARVLRARFLADVEDFAGAAREVERALRAGPNDADALAFGAALARVMGDSAAVAERRRRYTALYPREAGVHIATAELLARVRHYRPASVMAGEGAELDPKSWRAHALLGANLFRLGDVDAARKSLETAFKGDPYDIWTKNTLDLMDTFGEYELITSDKFRFVIEKAESQVLALYLRELLDRAYTTFVARYQFTPTGPVRVEVYRSHADFSVRTVGLAGLGALGVSFGNTIAFDSPAAKDAGPFNWGSTAWHELAHTFTLGASDNRVPRWLSEGLSVFEERRAHAGWGQGASPSFLRAYEDKKLVPASRLNDGFVRPQYPQHVIHSYYQASLVCELIARDWGEAALMQMLQAYRAGQSTDQVIARVLKTDPASFDKRFDAYMLQRFAGPLASIRERDASIEQYMPTDELVARAAAKAGNYWIQLAVGKALAQRGDNATAIEVLERARTLFPEYAGGDSPYPLLARAKLASGDRKGAIATLSAMVSLGEIPYELQLNLVELLEQEGDTAKAAAALENAMYSNPFDIAQHERLAGLFTRAGDRKKVVRERAAIVALRPVDRAEALYQLALAYRDAGDPANAKRSVLHALEDAPHFERAQDLLLAIVEGRRP